MMATATTRAWQSHDPGVEALQMSEVPVSFPGANEALVQVEAAALNFSDLLMIDDRYQVRPDRPFVPGQEIAGTVIAAGDQSTLQVGERIASKVRWGGFAEYAIVRGDMAIRIPDGMSFAAAAAIPVVYVTAMVALTEVVKIGTGDVVLVLAAAGGVGLAAVEIARHLGARVIATAGAESKRALAKAHGAHEAIDYRAAGWAESVKALTGDKGVNVIFDPVGGAQCVEALRTIAWDGRLLIVGFASGEITKIPANRLLLKRASAVGIYWDHDRDAPMIARVADDLTALARRGAIRPHVETYRFEDLPQALTDLRERRTVGKAVLIRSSEGATP